MPDNREPPVGIGPEPDLISLEELRGWILFEDENYLVVNKPGWVVCHPSKRGPYSSLVGACREYTGLEVLRLVNRLDRETSGVVVFAKNRISARDCQKALQERRVDKIYCAILDGRLQESMMINKPLARDIESPVYIKQTVRKSNSARRARSYFEPMVSREDFTLTRVSIFTGRKHQIRAHAEWMGHPIVGDKMYGPDDTLYLEFIENGWTDRMETLLPIHRQAIHAALLRFRLSDRTLQFSAPLPEDISYFCAEKMQLTEIDMKNLEAKLIGVIGECGGASRLPL